MTPKLHGIDTDGSRKTIPWSRLPIAAAKTCEPHRGKVDGEPLLGILADFACRVFQPSLKELDRFATDSRFGIEFKVEGGRGCQAIALVVLGNDPDQQPSALRDFKIGESAFFHVLLEPCLIERSVVVDHVEVFHSIAHS